MDAIFLPILIDCMEGIKIHEGMVSNSRYTTDQVIYPFVKSSMLIVGFIIAFYALKLIQKMLLRKHIYFLPIKRYLRFFESVVILLAVILAIYSKVDKFEYYRYGYNVNKLNNTLVQNETIYIPLEEIPSLQSVGVEMTSGSLLYSVFLKISQGMFYLSNNLDIIIAIAGAIILPLSNYAEAIEQEGN